MPSGAAASSSSAKAHAAVSRVSSTTSAPRRSVSQGVPITVLYVGHGEDEVPIAQLAKTIKALPKKIDKATMAAVIKRIDSISQSLTSLPIPKGIDPTKVRAQRPR